MVNMANTADICRTIRLVKSTVKVKLIRLKPGRSIAKLAESIDRLQAKRGATRTESPGVCCCCCWGVFGSPRTGDVSINDGEFAQKG